MQLTNLKNEIFGVSTDLMSHHGQFKSDEMMFAVAYSFVWDDIKDEGILKVSGFEFALSINDFQDEFMETFESLKHELYDLAADFHEQLVF